MEKIQIGNKLYEKDSITLNGQGILNDLKKVNQKIGDYNLMLSIIELAKGRLVEELEKELPKFKEIKMEETNADA